MGKTKGKFKRTGGKTGGRDFKPGQSGNPNGRPKAPEDQKIAMEQVRAMRSVLRFDYQHFYTELSQLSVSQLQRIAGGKLPDGTIVPSSEPDAPVLKLVVARGLLQVLRTSKAQDLQVHHELMCGPEPKQVELSGRDGQPLSPLSKYTQEQLAETFAYLDKFVQEAQCKSIQSSPQPSVSSARSLPAGSGTAS